MGYDAKVTGILDGHGKPVNIVEAREGVNSSDGSNNDSGETVVNYLDS
jgi:hypothetical protein